MSRGLPRWVRHVANLVCTVFLLMGAFAGSARALPVTQVSVTDSPPSAAASARTIYKVSFTTSSTGGLSGAAGSTITITFPTGTGLSNLSDDFVTDTTSGQRVGGDCNNDVNENGLVETCFIFSGNTVAAGDAITVELDGVTNPPTTSTQDTVAVFTSSDTSATSTPYTTVGSNPVASASVTDSPPSAAASARTTYKVSFTTSSTGALSGAAGSTITITFPSGTGLGNLSNDFVTDTTSGQRVGGDCNNTTTANPLVETCFIFNGDTVTATDAITVELDGVTNPSTVTTQDTVSVFTTSDTSATSSPYSVFGSNPALSASVTDSPPSAAAGARTTYKVSFTTSSTGALSGAAGSTITITFPSGTGLGNLSNDFVTDTTSGQRVGGDCNNTTTANPLVETCFIFNGDTVTATDAITVELDGVTNPSTVTTQDTVSVFTTSDTSATSSPYSVVNPHDVTTPGVALSNLQGSASGVDYLISFTTSSTGGLSGAAGSTITITFPSGTGLGNLSNDFVTDTTSGQRVGGDCNNTTTANPLVETCFIFNGDTVTATDAITVELDGVTNPTNVTASTTLSAFTTSDTGSTQSSPYQPGGPAPPPTIASISPTSGPNSGGTTVTITGANFTGATAVSFGNTAASGFRFNSDSQITATAPAELAGTVDITVTTPSGTSQAIATDQYTYTVQISSASAAPPLVTPSPPATQSSTSAGLSGSVNPNGLPTTAYFEYGIDLSDRGPGSSTVLYDQTTPSEQVGSDSTNHPISIPVSGLVPNALYHVRMAASNSAGTTVGPDQTFTTPASASPPPPVLGKAVDVAPVSGVVFIKPPPGKALAGDVVADAAQASKGQGFVPLTEARQIPSGSQIDALQGSLKLVTATGQVGKTQNGTFGGAIFTLTQDRTGITKGLTNLKLQEGAFQGAPSYATCQAKHKATDATIAALPTKTLQLLKASGHGKFKTTGRYASATVRGTIWTVADRCDGTLTHVIRDTVVVDDFVRHKTILLHSGQSYLAKAPGK